MLGHVRLASPCCLQLQDVHGSYLRCALLACVRRSLLVQGQHGACGLSGLVLTAVELIEGDLSVEFNRSLAALYLVHRHSSLMIERIVRGLLLSGVDDVVNTGLLKWVIDVDLAVILLDDSCKTSICLFLIIVLLLIARVMQLIDFVEGVP